MLQRAEIVEEDDVVEEGDDQQDASMIDGEYE